MKKQEKQILVTTLSGRTSKVLGWCNWMDPEGDSSPVLLLQDVATGNNWHFACQFNLTPLEQLEWSFSESVDSLNQLPDIIE